jgi:hypothetical protein
MKDQLFLIVNPYSKFTKKPGNFFPGLYYLFCGEQFVANRQKALSYWLLSLCEVYI